jgi:hypothetical protein
MLLGYERSRRATLALPRNGNALFTDSTTQVRLIAALFDVACCRAKQIVTQQLSCPAVKCFCFENSFAVHEKL